MHMLVREGSIRSELTFVTLHYVIHKVKNIIITTFRVIFIWKEVYLKKYIHVKYK